jgi:hypothetical protein
MAETWFIVRQNVPDGGQSGLDVGQASDIAAGRCGSKIATRQPVQLRQSGRFEVLSEFVKFRVHRILLRVYV